MNERAETSSGKEPPKVSQTVIAEIKALTFYSLTSDNLDSTAYLLP